MRSSSGTLAGVKSLPDEITRLTLALSALHPDGNVRLSERIGCGAPELAGAQRGRRALKNYLPALRAELGLSDNGFVPGRFETWVVRDKAQLIHMAPPELRIRPLLRVLSDAEARYVAWQSIADEAISNEAGREVLEDGGGPDDSSYAVEPPEDDLDIDTDAIDLDEAEQVLKTERLRSRASKELPHLGVLPAVYVVPSRRVPQQYLLASAHWQDTRRHVVIRGAPDHIGPLMEHFVDHGPVPIDLPYIRVVGGRQARLNELWTTLEGGAASVAAALDRLEQDRHSLWGSVRAVDRALQAWVEQLDDPEPRRGPAKRSVPDEEQLIRTSIADIYELRADGESAAGLTGLRGDGRTVPVRIAMASDAALTLMPASNAETHLIAVQTRSIRGTTIFEIVFEGPRSVVPTPMHGTSTVSVDDLRRRNSVVSTQQRLRKRNGATE